MWLLWEMAGLVLSLYAYPQGLQGSQCPALPPGALLHPLPSAGISHCHGTPSLLHRLFPITFHKKIHVGLSLSSHIYLGWEVCL